MAWYDIINKRTAWIYISCTDLFTEQNLAQAKTEMASVFENIIAGTFETICNNSHQIYFIKMSCATTHLNNELLKTCIPLSAAEGRYNVFNVYCMYHRAIHRSSWNAGKMKSK